MEDGLRVGSCINTKMLFLSVLILVLMEDGLRDEYGNKELNDNRLVLILVLMEDGLRASLVPLLLKNSILGS